MYRQSDAVFAGTVLDINSSPLDPVNVTFAVSRVWKGASTTMVALTTSNSGASCGFSFQRGVEYLVYAKNYNDQLSTGLCSGTKLLSQAQNDVYWLDHPTAPTAPLNYFLIVLAISAVAVMSTSVWLIRRWNSRPPKV